ncbi:hypothetical protein DL764_008871 [Monosporascus ibericus]|uniref:Uncharacterized protein n=1 Tax=Monosporascus ibericus TaxID=155417 RepID=A0A4V1X952_9PEZI|nr:hypothetical protein DL764_008871 [Monosporascus ibericus]
MRRSIATSLSPLDCRRRDWRPSGTWQHPVSSSAAVSPYGKELGFSAAFDSDDYSDNLIWSGARRTAPCPTTTPAPTFYPNFVWNGQVPTGKTSSKSCLPDPEPGSIEWRRGIDGDPPRPGPPAAVEPRPGPQRRRQRRRGRRGGGSISDLPVPGPITWGPSEPSTTCTSNCEDACDDFFCNTQPTGLPPDWEKPEPPEEDSEDPEDPPEEPEEAELDTPDPSANERSCYDSGQKSSYGKIDAAAQSFCRDAGGSAANSGGILPNFHDVAKKSLPGNYRFLVSFEVFEGCEWTYSFDECMRYYKVPIDSCDCSKKGDKQGETVRNSCIYARIGPNCGR